jgi:hypothetical protein
LLGNVRNNTFYWLYIGASFKTLVFRAYDFSFA